MSRMVVAVLALVPLVALASCHLADSADPVPCAAGTHPSDGHCVLDPAPGGRFTIAADEAGTGCSVSPASLTVAPNVAFEVENTDVVEHVIAGADGQTWATAKAGQLSPFIGITKAGTWPFTVSGCAKGGTVIVQ